ncbi:MAG: bifunctional UDP-N-acetylglucosamine diphosphorylase/glucosamine-1-phosphate N-acetyltransferase GlmU, partial [Myxococcota bacterium]
SGLLVTLYGDVPLLRPQTLSRLEKSAGKSMLSLLTARVSDPTGYGRVVQEGQQVQRIVEHKDATAEELQIDDINVGVYCADVELYRETVKRLKSDNQQKELYLTDVVEIASGRGPTRAVRVEDPDEIRGINTRVELAEAERTLRGWLVEAHQRNGVTFRDPATVILSENVSLGRDVLVGAGVQFYGTVKVGAGSQIEGPTVIKNAELSSDVKVEAFSHVEGAKLGRSVTVGPYARIRPDSQLDEGSRVGNFVELKKTRLGKGAKANHLSYLGDASIGADSNVGAGTITCNYDGFRKHQTRLGKNVFVGSNSTLVAPVNVGNDGYVGAGSVVTEDVPGGTLALGRSRQTNKRGYAKRLREKLKKE